MSEILQNFIHWFADQWNLWTVIGFLGQFMFMMRFVFQWIASEREKKSVMPEIFWYFSLMGGLIVFAYAIHKQDIVFISGQGLGVFIYLRNIYFIWHQRRIGQNA